MDKYHLTRAIDATYEGAIERVTAALKTEGFGVLTQIDVKSTLKAKLDVDFRNYVILGACHPQFAYRALQAEDKIGVYLPCNVVVQERADGTVEVSAMNPLVAMQGVNNPGMGEIASGVTSALARVLEKL